MSYLILPAVGFRPQIPHILAGILILPPMSVPIPSIDPPAAIRAPSPPDDPPGPRFVSWGFKVRPYIGFEHSNVIMVWGTLVRTKGTAPCLLRTYGSKYSKHGSLRKQVSLVPCHFMSIKINYMQAMCSKYSIGIALVYTCTMSSKSF